MVLVEMSSGCEHTYTINGSWVNGQVYVNYHCATFDKSDAYRHLMLRWLELRLSVKQLKMEFMSNWPPKAADFFEEKTGKNGSRKVGLEKRV